MEMSGSGFSQEKRMMSGSTSDIISNLPCDVLDKILVCLTIQDAARTSVLSRKWRYMWNKISELVFDDKFCRGSVTRETTDKLMMTIYNVLLVHRGPILKFTLSLANLKSCLEIDRLIFFISNNGLRVLTLKIWKGEPYKLPSTLFSCIQLEHLNLSSCALELPHVFEVFNMLLSLELNKVFIAGDVLSSLVSGCPLLERLTLRSSTSYDYLEIVTPNLKCSRMEGFFRSISFRIPYFPRNYTVAMKRSRNQLGFNEGELSNSAKLLGSLAAVEALSLDYPYLKFMAKSGVRERLPTTLNNLKVLVLHNFCFGEPDEISIVLYLIRCSPNLKGISKNRGR